MVIKMNPGKLNKRIQIIEYIDKPNKNGFISKKKESVVISLYASIKSLKGTEFIQAMAIQAESTKVFKCRYSRKLEETDATSMYVKYKNKVYNIKSIINENEENKYLIIHGEVVEKSE